MREGTAWRAFRARRHYPNHKTIIERWALMWGSPIIDLIRVGLTQTGSVSELGERGDILLPETADNHGFRPGAQD